MSLTITSEEINKLVERGHYYYSSQYVKIYCGTYDLNGNDVNETLSSWYCLNQDSDIYVFAFQRIANSNANENYYSEREQALFDYINTDICFGTSLKLLKRARVRGSLLFLYVKTKFFDYVSECNISTLPSSIFVGTKESVGISMKLYESRFCFICSWINPDFRLSKRNNECNYVLSKMRFGETDIYSHEYIFWLGNFGYRLDDLQFTDILSLISKNDFETMFAHDQLTNEMKKQIIFKNFNEGQIKFKPTYKYTPKTNDYDTNEKPYYADRILYRISENNAAILNEYSTPLPSPTISDHKPIYARFEIELKKYDEARYAEEYKNLIDSENKRINNEVARVSLLSPNTYPAYIDFGALKFYQSKTDDIKLQNESQSIVKVTTNVKFSEICHVSSDNPKFGALSQIMINKWFQISPLYKDKLYPNSIIKFDVSTDFNIHNIRRLSKCKSLDDTIFIECVNGNTIFVFVKCNYVQSIMGVSLAALSTLNETPFTKFDLDTLINTNNEITNFEAKTERSFTEYLEMYLVKNKRELANKKILHGLLFDIDTPINVFLEPIRKALVDDNIHFNVGLCKEYQEFLKCIYTKCVSHTAADTTLTNICQLSLDEQKQFVLDAITNYDFETLNNTNVSFDVLLQVLCDLLNSLPSAVIPERFVKMILCSNYTFESKLEVFEFIPRANVELFIEICKFIKTYTATANLSVFLPLADAVFQTQSIAHDEISVALAFINTYINEKLSPRKSMK